MVQALDRFRAALVKDETFSHARMGLIKAYFVRQLSGKGHMKPYLNPVHPDPAYHCGRLLALLAKLQYSALGDVGAGVRVTPTLPSPMKAGEGVPFGTFVTIVAACLLLSPLALHPRRKL